MKAKIKATGEIVEVVDYNDSIVTVYRNDETEFFAQNEYSRNEVELLPDTSEKVIEGWVTKDSPDDDVTFHFNRPYLRKDYPDDIEIWESIGSTYLFAQSLFPDLSSREPKRVKLTITPVE